MSKKNITDPNYDTYKAFKNRLDDIKEQNERSLGKQILIISGAAFTLTLTIIKDIYPNPIQWSKWLLILSWIIFGLAAFIQLLSMHFSSRAVLAHEKKLEDYYIKNDNSARERPNPYDSWVKKINVSLFWLIALGFICVIIFASANFIQKKEVLVKKKEPVKIGNTKKNTKDSQKRGVTMPTIPAKQESQPKSPPKKSPKTKAQ